MIPQKFLNIYIDAYIQLMHVRDSFSEKFVCVWTEFLLARSIFNVLGVFWVPKRTQLQNKLLSIW